MEVPIIEVDPALSSRGKEVIDEDAVSVTSNVVQNDDVGDILIDEVVSENGSMRNEDVDVPAEKVSKIKTSTNKGRVDTTEVTVEQPNKHTRSRRKINAPKWFGEWVE